MTTEANKERFDRLVKEAVPPISNIVRVGHDSTKPSVRVTYEPLCTITKKDFNFLVAEITRLRADKAELVEALELCIAALTANTIGTFYMDEPDWYRADWYRAVDIAVQKGVPTLAKATSPTPESEVDHE